MSASDEKKLFREIGQSGLCCVLSIVDSVRVLQAQDNFQGTSRSHCYRTCDFFKAMCNVSEQEDETFNFKVFPLLFLLSQL